MLVIPATWETEARGLCKPRTLRLAQGKKIRPCLNKQNQNNAEIEILPDKQYVRKLLRQLWPIGNTKVSPSN